MSLQTRLTAFIQAVGADIKAVQNQAVREAYTFSVAGDLTTKTGAHRIYLEGDYAIESVRASVGTPSSGTNVIVDINRNGSTIYGTQANRPSIATASYTALGGAYSNGVFSANDYLMVDVDQVGSVAAGADLTVVIRLRKTS